METTLHRQLKSLYSTDSSQEEVTVDGYRIDVIRDDEFVEIQCASLAAIRDKTRHLLESYNVRVVKPLAARKYLVTRKRKGGAVTSSRYSPTRETIFDLFLELVHFVTVFPHPRLCLEIVLTEQEEHRVKRKTRRRRAKDYRVEDRLLREVHQRVELRSADDLAMLLPASLPSSFTTTDIAREAEIPRWLAQKLAYCLRQTNAAAIVGKQGNALVYEFVERKAA